MKKFGQSLKATAFSAALLAGVGMAGEAKALTFGSGDLVLAMFGNNTQYLQNLGQVGSFFAPGSSATINIAPATLTAIGGTNAINWALVSWSVDGFGDPSTLAASSSKNLSAFTPGELAAVSVSSSWNSAAVWSGQSAVVPGTSQLIATSDPTSYTSVFGTDGSMASGFNVSTQGLFGSVLAVLEGQYNDSTALIQLGTASLSGDGLSLILAGASAPVVPIPAAVILFGTGLAGLVGVARRKLIVA